MKQTRERRTQLSRCEYPSEISCYPWVRCLANVAVRRILSVCQYLNILLTDPALSSGLSRKTLLSCLLRYRPAVPARAVEVELAAVAILSRL